MSGVGPRSARRTYLVGGHRKGVNVTLLRGVAIHETKMGWIQQLRRHVTDSSWLRPHRAARVHNGWICDDTRDSEVSNACIPLLGDQDVPLDMTDISASLNPRTPYHSPGLCRRV